MPAGRPSKYKDEYAEQARKLCEFGATDQELAQFFEVGLTTIERWIAKHQEFRGALKAGKEKADDRVERSLYQRAIGYSHPEDKIFNDGGEPLIVPTVKHYPPDTTAAIFWLKNRRKEDWRDKQEVEHSSNKDAPLVTQILIAPLKADDDSSD